MIVPPPTRRLRLGEAAGWRVEAALEPELEREALEPLPRRVGVLGGTFDPPHIGHLWLATMAADAQRLDRVLFIPASQPPHKTERPVGAPVDRLLMTRLAIEGDRIFELSRIEMERPGPSYTVDTLTELRSLYPEAELFLVMAADSLAEIHSWREPDRILELAEWIVGPRPGAPAPDGQALKDRFGEGAGRIHLLSGPALDVSSSEIRRRVAAGHAIRYLVPRSVEQLIHERGLYRA